MNHASQNNNAFTGTRMMRILNDNFKRLFLGSMSWAHTIIGSHITR